ncbi:MAG: hypothetical protein AAFO07_00415 [Bacteroidota bacterium]
MKLLASRSGLIMVLFFAGLSYLDAQSYAFGVKGGLTVGLQRWGNTFNSREPLFRYHGDLFIETADSDEPFALFASGGYRIKGSAIRFRRQVATLPDGSVREFGAQTIPFEFHNLSVVLGAKQKFPMGYSDSKLYYSFGVRVDYTIDTKLRPDFIEEDDPFAIFYPIEGFVNEFNYGITVGGGIEVPFTELIGMILELNVSPDFSRQYNQPQINNVINTSPFATNPTVTIPERMITNLVFELSLGFRFMNKVIIVD